MPRQKEQSAIARAFDPEQFRAEGHALIDKLSDYLSKASLGQMPVLSGQSPEGLLAKWGAPDEHHGDSLASLLDEVIADSNHLHHPHYMGHQCAVPLPDAALCEFAAALLNNTNVFEMAPVGTILEKRCIEWMAKHIGFSPKSDGMLTSGGSLGNLTALSAAQQVMTKQAIWEEGAASHQPLAVLASAQAHYSVQRVLQIMGWGRGGVVAVPTKNYAIDPGALLPALREAQSAGRRVIGVVANACSTATGTYDDIDAIADFCEAQGLWLHVDGAHGASALLSEKYRHLLKGIERADSVVWDAHKMLMMPALATGVIFKDGRHSFQTFSQKASYLFEKEPEAEWYNMAQRTFECTRGMLSLKLYAALRLMGERALGDFVTGTYDISKQFHQRLKQEPDFETPHEPQSNILCFRYAPLGVHDLDALQVRVRRALISSGRFHLVQTTLENGVHLRVSLMNPFTSMDDFETLIADIRRVAAAP